MRNTQAKVHYIVVLTMLMLIAVAKSEAVRADEGRGMLRPDAVETSKLLTNASTAFSKLLNSTHGSVPDSVLKNARCIGVFPSVITAAAIIGGSHGDGVVSCKLVGGKWSAPAFYELNGAGMGAQIGAKSTDLVLFFNSGPAVAALKHGTFDIGGDLSVVAGNFDKSFDSSNAGIVAFQESSGAYIGASLNGGKFSANSESDRTFYGRSVEALDLLEGRTVDADNRASDFTSLLR